MLDGIVKDIPETSRMLIEAFWPGPLTLIFKKTEAIPGIVTANLNTVAVRMPGNATALSLITEAGVPVAAPSANNFGRPSPTQASHVLDDLRGKIEMIIDGGPCRVGVESTVVDVTGSSPVILRPGGIDRESLEKVAGKVELFRTGDTDLSISPGLMKQHYAPKAKLLLFEGQQDRVLVLMKNKIDELTLNHRVGVLAPEEVLSQFDGRQVVMESLGSFNDLETVAKNLFSRMRSLDSRGVDYILALAPPRQRLGLAIFDRLYKAAGSQVITVD